MQRLLVHRASVGVSLQDAGRRGYLRYGISAGGPMDWARHRMVNRMLDRAPGEVAIEFGPAGLGLSLDSGVLQLSFSGPGFRLISGDSARTGPRRFMLEAGQSLEIMPNPGAMWGYLGIQAKLMHSQVLDSYSENTASGLYSTRLGEGSELRLCQEPIIDPQEQAYIDPYIAHQDQPIDILPSSQYEQFSTESRGSLVEHALSIAPRFDRMAYQLQGVNLSCEKGYDILSDGVTMGAIQVPGDGRPFVLMADHQPTGGYPKIACVCMADLPRLANMTPGRPFVLRWVGIEQALKKWRFLRQQIDSLSGLKGA